MSNNQGSPFSRSDYHLAEDMFREAVESNLAEEDNLSAVREVFEERIAEAFDRGEFMVEVKRLTSDHMWARVNNRAGVATANMVKEINSGQIALDLDAWLDQVVTVGKLRRSTIRHLGRGDWDRIVAVRQENSERAAEALEATRWAAEKSIAAMEQCGSMAEAAPTFMHSTSESGAA